MSTLTITIDRTLLSLSPLVLSGADDANVLGVQRYSEPAVQWRVGYAPDSAHIHGSVPLSGAYQQALLNFEVVTDNAASEAQSRTQLTELREALAQFRFDVTVVVDGAPSETWACHLGSMAPLGPRSSIDLRDSNPVWAVAIPCHPVPTVGA